MKDLQYETRDTLVEAETIYPNINPEGTIEEITNQLQHFGVFKDIEYDHASNKD